ncbi:helix-turn-helix domain-containing protein [Euzebya pacifica]|uniref:helix-turn-helix domain-containing protein n=1 Tax=Euzebya pacifica TaxID=1608957 RepID=UPI000DF837B7|nr:helix-turn-helix domain-containing protein [Euzebya pacifica]
MTLLETRLADFLEAATGAVRSGLTLRISVGDQEFVVEGEDAETALERLGTGAPTPADTPSTLTTGQAADLLGVSRATVVRLVDAGEIPATRVGTHRRLALEDVVAYQDRARTNTADALDDVTRLSDSLGHYS